MSVLDRKLGRELLAAKGLLSAIVGIIVIGVTSFVTMATAYFNLEQSRRSYYAQCRMADFSVELKKLPLQELDRLDEIEGITQLRPRITFEVTVDLEGVDKPLSGRVISMPDQPAPVINDIVLKSGGYFTQQRRAEVILNDAFARARDIRTGDRIHVLLNNRRQELIVVGTAISSEFVYLLGPGGLIPDPENYGVLYIERRFAEEVFDFQGACNQIVGLLDAAHRQDPDDVLSQIETRLEPFGVATTTPRSRQSSHWFLTAEIEGLRSTVTILPTIFLAVAALILNVLMTRIAEQQRTVVGTLKALGYANRQLFWHFLKFGAAVGLAGGVLGSLIGYWLAGLLTTEIYSQYFEFPQLVNRPYPPVLLAGLGISEVFAVTGTMHGVRLVMKLRPAEAMRPKPPLRGRHIWLEGWRGLWRRLDFRWQIVLRGIFRHRMRSGVGVVVAAVGAALILVTFHLRDAANEMLAFQFDKILLSDIDLALKDEHDYAATFEARRLPGVEYCEPVFQFPCTFHHGHRQKQGSVSGILPDARLTVPRDVNGSAVPVPDVGLVLTRKLADVLDVEAGQHLTIVPVQGVRDEHTAPVAAVVDSYLGLAAYADFGYLNRLAGEEESVNLLQMKVHPGPLVELYRSLKQLPAVQSVQSIREQKRKLEELLVEQMLVSITIVIVFAGLMFFGSILNSSLISLSERQVEMATLRVLGYSSREVGVIFLRESLVLNVVGVLLGLPLGYWLSIQIDAFYNTELYRFPMIIHPSSWLTTVGLGLVFTLIAHLPVQRTINTMNWLATLNVKE